MIKTTIAWCFSLLILTHSPAWSAESSPSNESLVVNLTEIVNSLSDDKAGMSVLVRVNDNVLFKASKGLANKHLGTEIDFHTGFRIASVSKPFTALAIMMLVERQLISLDMAVTHFLPQLPKTWNGITIEHLLTHRVFISNDFFSDTNLRIADQSGNQHLIAFVSSPRVSVKPLPKDKAIYCNSCYVLLAEVVAKAAKTDFATFMADNIFKPANMQDSYIISEGQKLAPGDALNYAKSDSFFGINQFTTGAMAQVSSLDDLEHFIIALQSHQLISESTLASMTRIHSDLGRDGFYGLGWTIGWQEVPFFSHGGEQDGYRTELFFYPKHHLEVAILSNGGESTFRRQRDIMKALFSHFKLGE